MAPGFLAVLVAGQVLLPEPIASMEQPLRPPLSAEIGFTYRIGRVAPNGAQILGHSLTREGLTLHLRFVDAVTPIDLKAIRAHGCRIITTPDGVEAVIGSIADAFCQWAALPTLHEISRLARVEPTGGGKVLRPMLPKSTTLNETGITRTLEKAWPQRNSGANILIGDMDSGFDPFHPLHFHADGGNFQWLDVDKDGVFTPGIDAVDFNRNGVVDVGETLRVLQPNFYAEYTEQEFDATPNTFTPGVDWLYQDENENGTRDFGPQFTDMKPTFGEQLFVADDVDGNGTLDPGEPVVALNSPKVRALLTRDHVYKRGVDLSQYVAAPGGELHANMVVGTLVGGDARLTRYCGAAPDADVVLAENDEDMLVEVGAWAQKQGAQIMLWEMANWFLEFLDGSSAPEAANDALTDAGILQLAAAGNLGTSQKHIETFVPAGMPLDLPVTIPDTTPSSMIATLLWKNEGEVDASLTWGTITVPLSGATGMAPLGPTTVVWAIDASSRGTHKLDVFITLGATRPTGDLNFTVNNQTATELDLRGYLEDPESGWAMGVAWNAPGVTDKSTYGTPAVGDSTLAIATYLIDWPFVTMAGDLTFYSSQGPRADDRDTIDFATPEDHWTAPYSTTTARGVVYPFGSYFVGSGTSDATPMATGVATVLLSANPTWTVAQLETAMQRGAQMDIFTGSVPNDKWGYGKLSAYRALTGANPGDALPPIARGTAQLHGDVLLLDATGSIEPNGLTLQYRWNINDDDTWDVAPTSSAMTSVMNAPTGAWVRLEAENPLGLVGARMIPIVSFLPVTDPSIATPDTLGAVAHEGCGCDDTGATASAIVALALLLRARVRAPWETRSPRRRSRSRCCRPSPR